jgi:hypothetical protein
MLPCLLALTRFVYSETTQCQSAGAVLVPSGAILCATCLFAAAAARVFKKGATLSVAWRACIAYVCNTCAAATQVSYVSASA